MLASLNLSNGKEWIFILKNNQIWIWMRDKFYYIYSGQNKSILKNKNQMLNEWEYLSTVEQTVCLIKRNL